MSAFERAGAALERLDRFGIHPSLDTVTALCERLGSPQRAFRAVQVTGTNGKTSVTRMIGALLAAHGEPAGVYTSPHLLGWTERVGLHGAPVTREAFGRAVLEVVDAARAGGFSVGEEAEPPDADAPRATQFEVLTCAALVMLREAGVSWAVLEVGMGGRWDATSVVTPAVAVITGVGLEHREWLGETVEAIAAEKAQIVRAGSVAVLGAGTEATDAVFAARAADVGARIVRVRGTGGDATWRVTARPTSVGGATSVTVTTAHRGYALELRAPAYQASNAAVAVAAAEEALGRELDEEAVHSSLAALAFPGRFETLSTAPPLVVDGAHNPQAAVVLSEAVRDAWPSRGPVALLGSLDDKDVDGVVSALAPVVSGFVATSSGVARALSAGAVADVVERVTGTRPWSDDDSARALSYAQSVAGPDGVLATGSLTVAAAVKRLAGAG